MGYERTASAQSMSSLASLGVNRKFAILGITLQIIMIFLYAFCASYAPNVDASVDTDTTEIGVGTRYAFFQDIHVMMFIGFAFLMAFLKKHTFGSVGFNFMIASFTIQWAILLTGFWECVYAEHWEHVNIDLKMLIRGDFGAAAVLITFGVVLGKVNPLQLLVIAFIEIIFYTLNEMIVVLGLGAADIGGSMVIHTFGAYFGIACGIALGPANAKKHPLNNPRKSTDTFAMIGTIFLWMFWPSFNAAMADGSRQHRAVLNTVLSLTGSCISSFIFSGLLRPENLFSMVDIQNASLAGGVAVGSCADMMIRPWGAITVGFFAGAWSTYGFNRIQLIMQEKFALYDTCGVHNLHGMPGIIGGVAAAIAASVATRDSYGDSIGLIFPRRAPSDPIVAAALGIAPGVDRSSSEQAMAQFAALCTSIVLGLFSGAITGVIIRQPFFGSPTTLFDDSIYWHVEPETEVHENKNNIDNGIEMAKI
eukprot:c18235_g1_i1.p1 GENE.c18235_g1_i1~~c18235_g1_i1.p1  ORF type:complete len:478 (+),score=169.97 c18235_g1_i1:58-1491(+)